MLHGSSLSRRWFLVAMILSPSLALAHSGAHSAGFIHGLEHPISGLDHLLAMLAVGLWAVQRGGRALWAVPLAFIGMMSLGGLLGLTGWNLPQFELGILSSVLILGVVVALAVRLPVWQTAVVVGTLAVFHGFAHTVETPHAVSALTYNVGFLLSTAALHLGGIGLGVALAKIGQTQWLRLAGGAIALVGIGLFLQ